MFTFPLHSDSQLTAQINVLNQDYSGSGLTFTLAGTTRTVNSQWFSQVGPDSSLQTTMKKQVGWIPHRRNDDAKDAIRSSAKGVRMLLMFILLASRVAAVLVSSDTRRSPPTTLPTPPTMVSLCFSRLCPVAPPLTITLGG